MKNSKEVLEKINGIRNLEDEIVTEIVTKDLQYYEINNIKEQFVEDILGEKAEKLKDSEIINKLIEIYKEGAPYIGYCEKYWKMKKNILKEKYNIEWYSPKEENPNIMFD